MKFISFILLFCMLVIIFPNASFAARYEGLGPISIRIQNPLYLQNLGLKPRRAETLPLGTMEVRVDSAYSNLYEYGWDKKTRLDMDMEYWRLGLNVHYGITDDLEVGMEIPFVHFEGGFLDAEIQNFHSFFGFPNGGRESISNGRFSYRFMEGSVDLFNYPPATFGVGDISFSIKHRLAGEDNNWPDISWFSDIKLPTGRKSRGFGSGSPDFGLGIALDASYKRLYGHFNCEYLLIGGNSAIDDYVKNQSFAYMVAGEYVILPSWSAIVQLNGQTPMFKSADYDSESGIPLDLVVGFKGIERNIINGGDLIWQFGFTEDVTSKGPSVDFTVFMSIGFRFDILGRHRPVGDWLASTDD